MKSTTSSARGRQIGYWIVTLFVMVPMFLSGLMEVTGHVDAQSSQTLKLLGYPEYLPRIIGFWKVVGVLTIAFAPAFRFKEAAYVGFGLLFSSATASHLLGNDAAHAAMPGVMLAILIVSYTLRPKLSEAV